MKIYTTLDPDLQQAGLNAISIVPARVDYMNLGASGVQVEVGTGRILSMVQNRPYSIEIRGSERPDHAGELQRPPAERRRRPFRGVDLQGLQPRQLAGAGSLRQRDPQRPCRHEEGHQLRRPDAGRRLGNNGNGIGNFEATRATPERSTTSPATRSTRDSSRWRRRSRSARRTRSR
jgi:hypothetical protein